MSRPMVWSLVVWLVPCSLALGEGSIAGKVNWDGKKVRMKPIKMEADPKCAALHPDPVRFETVIVNDNHTLKNVFVYVKKGLEGKKFDVPAEPVTIDQKGCTYVPHVFGMMAGQKLLIRNSDPLLHNIHALPKNSPEFNFGQPRQGMEDDKRTFKKAEVMVKFKCDVHPWMSAYVGVLDHPFFAVSGDDGTFEIKGLPAGSYTIESWHEKYGVQEQQVTVADGAPTTVEFTYRKAQKEEEGEQD